MGYKLLHVAGGARAAPFADVAGEFVTACIELQVRAGGGGDPALEGLADSAEEGVAGFGLSWLRVTNLLDNWMGGATALLMAAGV